MDRMLSDTMKMRMMKCAVQGHLSVQSAVNTIQGHTDSETTKLHLKITSACCSTNIAVFYLGPTTTIIRHERHTNMGWQWQHLLVFNAMLFFGSSVVIPPAMYPRTVVWKSRNDTKSWKGTWSSLCCVNSLNNPAFPSPTHPPVDNIRSSSGL